MPPHRYQRQIDTNLLGAEGQARLGGASVLIVGAGGLGNVVAPLLAGAGVGAITLVDHDVVEVSNLHRQTCFTEADLGASKATRLADTLRRLNSSIVVQAVASRCHAGNVEQLVGDADVVVDAADNFAVTYLLSHTCQRLHTPLVAASVNRAHGTLGTFCGPSAWQLPTYRDVFPRVPDQLVSCATVGVLGPSVALLGALQAQETLKVLTQETASPMLYQVDAWNYSISQFSLNQSSEPSTGSIGFLSHTALSNLSNAHVVDVREPDEVAREPLAPLPHPHSEVPLSQLTSATPLPEADAFIFVCKSGQRALIAAQRASLNPNCAPHIGVLLTENPFAESAS